ncbi:MAG TPA: hypothetical protein ENN53_05160 [Candidatus Acetothermia bacterium]|nr:hypothetical protein [Candidatus Acetothermia bacterium]
MDGRSPAYAIGSAIVVDVLPVQSERVLVAELAHEMHHIGLNSVLAESGGDDPAEAQAWSLLRSIVLEGSAVTLVGGRRCTVLAAISSLC